MANLACLELHPHPVRAEDLDHPDELRVDLDPVPGVEWRQVQDVAQRGSRDARRPRTGRLAEDLRVARHPRQRAHSPAMDASPRCAAPPWRWRAKWNGARRRLPPASGGRKSGMASSSTTTRTPRTAPSCSAFSVRPRPDARVSTPLTWEEIDVCDPADFTMKTMPAWFKANGDRHAEIDTHPGSLDALLELSAKQEKEGQGDAPWPPQYQKMPGEPTRVQPSRARHRQGSGASQAQVQRAAACRSIR